MRSLLVLLLAGLLLLCLSGCLYVHTIEPLTTDMHRTPVSDIQKTGTLDVIAFPPFIGNYPLVAWGKAAIGEVAKREAMSEVYFADVETFSILKIYNRYTIHVHGK